MLIEHDGDDDVVDDVRKGRVQCGHGVLGIWEEGRDEHEGGPDPCSDDVGVEISNSASGIDKMDRDERQHGTYSKDSKRNRGGAAQIIDVEDDNIPITRESHKGLGRLRSGLTKLVARGEEDSGGDDKLKDVSWDDVEDNDG